MPRKPLALLLLMSLLMVGMLVTNSDDASAKRRRRTPTPTPAIVATTPAPTNTQPPAQPTNTAVANTATAAPTKTATAAATGTATKTPSATQTASADIVVVAVGDSIQAALDKATKGQTIALRGGTHVVTSTLVTRVDGVTITNYQNEAAVVDGNSTVDPLINVGHADTIANLTMQNVGGTYGDVILVSGNGAVIKNVTASGAPQALINVKAGTNNTTITGCDVSHATTGVQISGTNVVVDGCYFHDMDKTVHDGGDCSGSHGGQGVAVNYSPGPVTVRNSKGNNLKANSICYGLDGAFVEIYKSQNVLVENNIDSNGVVFVEANGDTTNNRLNANEVHNEAFLTMHQANGMTITNNQVYDLTGNSYFGGSTSGMNFSKNVIRGNARFFWIDQTVAPGVFSGNSYSFTGSSEFGYANSTHFKTADQWETTMEGSPVATTTVVPATTVPTTAPTSTPAPSGTAAAPTATKTATAIVAATATKTATATVAATATPTAAATKTATPTGGGGSTTFVAAGDVACDPANGGFNGGAGSATTCHMNQTLDLIKAIQPAFVLMLGDAQYESGTASNLAASYDKSWGQVKGITYAVGGGSHDFYGGGDFATYFGSRAGAASQNWYSFDVNGWHIIVLNNYCSTNGNCAAMKTWLANDLANNSSSCTLASWHSPRYSSGYRHGSDSSTDWMWDMLVNSGAEIVLSGHEHEYERFGPIGTSDNASSTGMVQFVVGTGGKSLETAWGTIQPNSLARNNSTYGVLKMTLSAGQASYQFVPEAGKTFTDSGTITCH